MDYVEGKMLENITEELKMLNEKLDLFIEALGGGEDEKEDTEKESKETSN